MKVEVDVLGSTSLILLPVSVDMEEEGTKYETGMTASVLKQDPNIKGSKERNLFE